MGYRAIHRFARIAPRKARLVAEMICGLDVERALHALEHSKKRAAWYFRYVLESAVANAEEGEADRHSLYVSECRVDEGPVIKRWRPKDRGRAHPFKKRMSHLHVTVDERKAT